MKHGKIKNIILTVMVICCVYLSSNVWLKLPDFIKYETSAEENDDISNVIIQIWNVVKPVKHVINYNENYTVDYSDENNMWGKAVQVLNNVFAAFNNADISLTPAFPTQYLKFDFSDNIPVGIFTGQMQINNRNISDTIKYIKNVIIDLDNANSIYIYNGENTIKITSSAIDTTELADIIKQYSFENSTQFAYYQKIGNETIQVPIPLETVARNPIFVRSELDVFDTEAINRIARGYFKKDYDYVRKSVEVNGNVSYMYRTQKLLRITGEGLLDFYDATTELENSSDVYESFVAAVGFTEGFLGFPKDVYLSDVESIDHDGNHGYRYTFSYKIIDRPILFSRVRANSALQIDVVGDDVVVYKRFIRNINESQSSQMNEIAIIPAIDVINKNLDYDTSDEGSDQAPELRPLKEEMIKDISNIYLGYFDLSRVSGEQLLRVCWVIEVKDKTFIFNAITGSLIEEW
ncbi:hypothetical protein HZF24_03695 [Sedimentibacter hydroxybenzoicus DSM 7310]|uniref:Two-component signal transduction system YycFG, regulatory protein YycH n=1 Tax=Sedimentibacter hydroxybenzoicus DSM 7310 TaxID=1123245 RepID=A0A974GVC7_SEDHY|nr:hypothetical protein [Sedimentibacter hydroxybenzoicus]NYB73237.1 hypothetical protein [Sedimentibacter hydroxybenzoicus DSM 7310]